MTSAQHGVHAWLPRKSHMRREVVSFGLNESARIFVAGVIARTIRENLNRVWRRRSVVERGEPVVLFRERRVVVVPQACKESEVRQDPPVVRTPNCQSFCRM